MPEAAVGLAMLPAALDWIAVGRGSRRAEYLLKPLALVALIVAAGLLRDQAPGHQWAWTMVALALSLAGDVFLMLPRDLFVAGLASFLGAHVCYVVAFNPTAPPAVAAGISLAVALVAGVALLGRMWRGIEGPLRGPVVAYLVAISLMVASAWATLARPGFPDAPAAAAAAGATLFIGSDALIAWGRFVGRLRGGPVAIIVLYHLGQAGLVLSLGR